MGNRADRVGKAGRDRTARTALPSVIPAKAEFPMAGLRQVAWHCLVAAGILLLSTPPLHAQVSRDSILQRIWTVGMDSSLAEPLGRALFDSLGPRLTGSPGLRAANDWLVKTYTSWGITARNERYGTWRGWRRGTTHIDLVAPRTRSLEGTMLGWSPGTGDRDVTAGTVILPHFKDSTEFVAWLPQARGKYVLVAPGQPTCRPTDDWTANATPESARRMDSLRQALTAEWRARIEATGYSLALGTGSLGLRLEQAGIAGIVTSRPTNGWGTFQVFETYDTIAPAVALSCEDYGLVYRLTEDNRHPQLRMNLEAELLGEQPVANTIATIPGSKRKNEYVILSAHLDAWDAASGANDNGAGTLIMMEAMRILKRVLPHPQRTILAGHWTGEEQGLVGSRAFSEDHPEVVKGLQFMFNHDLGTGRVNRIHGAGLPDAAAHLEQWLSRLPAVFQEQVKFEGTGQPSGGSSDHAPFNCQGAPAMLLGSAGWDYGKYDGHTNRDSYDKVVYDDIRSDAVLLAMLAYEASEDPAFISRERAPGTWPACQPAPRHTRPRLR